NTRVVVEFAAGYEVTLDTSTAIFIENPSIFLRIGQAFIRRIRGGLDKLTTNTPQAVLHDISTAYLVSVDARATSVRVAEGTVEAQSRDTRFPPARYQAFEHGEITNEGRWSRMGRMPPAELERQTSWVRLVERLSKIPVPRLDSMTEAQARAALQEVGLRTLLVMRRASGRFAPGLVIDHTPSAGERVAPGTFVNLVLEKEPSREQPANSCTVPEITGRTEAEGKRLLAASRLVGEATQRASGEVDVITSQQEEAGTRVRCGSTVHYT
ncbi:MAG: PASTA domain-containing protein, partial [Gemmatimonadaceae bacterium]